MELKNKAEDGSGLNGSRTYSKTVLFKSWESRTNSTWMTLNSQYNHLALLHGRTEATRKAAESCN